MFIFRKIRISYWLLQSFLGRYKRYIMTAFIAGSALSLVLWISLRYLVPVLFPSRIIIGFVGSYEPSRLPPSVQSLISSGLTRIDESGEILPSASSSWESNSEGTRYFFHLQDNLTWHDGDNFVAHDVDYQFKDVVIAPADSKLLKVELSEPFAPLPALFARPLLKTGLVGIGPYRVASIVLKEKTVDRIVLSPFDNPRTVTDERTGKTILEFRFYQSPSAAVTAFKLGEIEELWNISSPDELQGYPDTEITEHIQFDRFLAVYYNVEHPLLKAKEFRQALSYAIPALEGRKVISPIPETSWAHYASVRDYKYNVELATTLMERASVGTQSGNLTIATFPEYVDIAQTIAASWNELGVPTDTRVIHSFQPASPNRGEPDFAVLLGVQEISYDPDQYQLWHSTQRETNISHYNNPKIDKLLEEGRKETDKEKRLEIYREFQRYLVDDAPVRFLIHPVMYTIKRK
ncbi:MAG TPA: ABC transporter substrate-binding protein [Patescibacteria group bacterium]|nr:ABC transporter substrate-binding protein [Patescibacteria group bacterium]